MNHENLVSHGFVRSTSADQEVVNNLKACCSSTVQYHSSVAVLSKPHNIHCLSVHDNDDDDAESLQLPIQTATQLSGDDFRMCIFVQLSNGDYVG